LSRRATGDRGDEGAAERIGVLGGTFNPIHHAHLFSAEVAAAAFHLDRVLLVPAGQNPLKSATEVSAAQRLEMTRLAAAGNSLLEVSTVDVDRPPPSYTVDTMAQLASARPGATLFLIVGADALPDFPDWREPDRLLALCELIVLSRPGVPPAIPRAVSDRVGRHVDRIHLQRMPELDISSTDLRRRFASGEPVRYLLPEAVERYVRDHGLYGAATPFTRSPR
jgi:nicotinate-nucleotide adenylyltransferase